MSGNLRQQHVPPVARVSGVDEYWEASPEAAFDVEIPDRLPVACDEKLRTAVERLIENAIEHNNDKPRVRSVVNEDGPVVRIADDGPEIPEQERAVVSGGQEITQPEQTSGLGLWLVKWVVEAAGGTVSFAHRDESGTEVVVELRDPNSEVDFE